MATAPEHTETTTDNAQQELSLRDEIDQAFEQHQTDEIDAPASPPPAREAPAGDRARDERGRFAPGATQPADGAAVAQPVPQQHTGAAAPQPTTAPQPTAAADLKAPASWRPETREKWASVDPEIKMEVHRREQEMQQVLYQGAQTRQFVDAFSRTVAPYEMFIRDEQTTPLGAVQNLMQAAATLRVGTPLVKAQLVANVIKQHDVSIETLDEILAGMRPNGAAQQQAPQYDPRIDAFLAQQNLIMQQVLQKQDEEMRTQLSTFASGHEFYTDVAAQMADIVEWRARRNEPIDLEKIYGEACRMHEGVHTILSQRTAATSRNGSQQAVLRARRAATSVRGDSTPHDGATVPKDDSVRAALEAAFDARSHE